jgi:GMP reductase
MKSKELSYKDVLLLPNFSEVDSRKDVDTTFIFTKGSKIYKFRLPIVPANMKTVTDTKLSYLLDKKQYFYIMHRFGESNSVLCNPSYHWYQDDRPGILSISVGVNSESISFINKFKQLKLQEPNFITIDIAHGFCAKMYNMIQLIKSNFPESFLIAGNICTSKAAECLTKWGADCIKVGIGTGSVCITRMRTGFSRPQFSAILECRKATNIPIIADGGIEEDGDIAKALVAGANMVMIGGSLAGYEESPGGTIVSSSGNLVKEFYGSASEYNKEDKSFIEGRRIEVPYRGSIFDRLERMEQSLRSSISYAGGKDLTAFNNVEWICC